MPGLSRALSLMKTSSLGVSLSRFPSCRPGLVPESFSHFHPLENVGPLVRHHHKSHPLSLSRRSSGKWQQYSRCFASPSDSILNPAEVSEPAHMLSEAGAPPPPDGPSEPPSDWTTKGEPQKAKGDGAKSSPERRRKGPVTPVPDLMTVKGIGPRNMEKLVAKGIGKLVELKQLYREKFRTGGVEKLVEYLVASVGVHKNHANVIASFIKEAVDKEVTPESVELPKPKRLTFCVEGNISVGKTTFLQRIANETIELRDLVEVVPEPIGKWQDVGKDHFNVLDAFYAEPQRYAYTFQNYVFVTRMMQERESANGIKPLRLMERSVFSDRMVFVRAVHEAKWMSEMEISIYDSWFDPVVSQLSGLVPDGFIYLRASPDACHRRLMTRKRPEEQNVSLEYLRGLHEKHEQWLFPTSTATGSVMSLREWQTNNGPPSTIKDRVFYLEGDHVHSSIRKVPALVLDCEASIDFSKDVEAKAEYARQVADFFEYVKQTRSTSDNPVDNLLLPSRAAKILGPDGLLLQH